MTQKKVLIVDDEPSIRQLVRQSLEPSGYQIYEASDGLSALAETKKTLPDLLVLDVMMPKMNGFDLAAILKNDLQLMHIPIMMLTVMPDEKRGYGIGVNVYLRKPITPDKIREEVANIFTKHATEEKNILLAGKDTPDRQGLVQRLQNMNYIVHQASSIDQFSMVKGLPLTMIIVEENFVNLSELQLTLNNIGQSTTLIRLLSPQT